MILLPAQLQALTYMVFAGWLYGVLYSLLNRLTYCIRGKLIKYGIEVVIQVGLIITLYLGLYKINHGFINLYLLLMFILGLYLYLRFYSILFLTFFEKLLRLIKLFIRPFLIVLSKISVIIRRQYKRLRRKLKWKKKRKKHIRKKEK